jgi:methyl-accepting chemotaxis protein
LNNLDQTTQHNAAMAEETTAATQSLLLEAQKLTDATGHFTIEEGSAKSPVRSSTNPVRAAAAG